MKEIPFRLLLVLLGALTGGGAWSRAAATSAPAAATEEAPKIEGQAIARVGGGWLGLKVEGGAFRLRFYDADKKPVAPDVGRAILRWKSNRRIAREVAVLTPGGGPNLMASEKSVPPPYNFRLTIVLMRAGAGDSEADEAAAESISVDFRQDAAGS
jgi:hypothetical protein